MVLSQNSRGYLSRRARKFKHSSQPMDSAQTRAMPVLAYLSRAERNPSVPAANNSEKES